MYTLSGNILKLTAQMAPVGERSEPVRLQARRNGRWQTLASAKIDPLSRAATFRVPRWNPAEDAPFRVLMPIPQTQMDANPLLVQNPGY